jgi:hypothetical protein
MKPIGLIAPAQPIGTKAPPGAPGWLHEIKHDGFRIMAWRNSRTLPLVVDTSTCWHMKVRLGGLGPILALSQRNFRFSGLSA